MTSPLLIFCFFIIFIKKKENIGKKIQGDENCVGCKRKGKRIFRKTKISSIKERDTISGLGKKNLY